MSGNHKNRIAGDIWRAERRRIETGPTVRNRRKTKLNGKPHLTKETVKRFKRAA